MIHYLYVHNDARQARAMSTWVAMAKAIGRDEARALFGSAQPLVWGPTRARPASVSGTVRQLAFLHGPDSRRIGTFYELD